MDLSPATLTALETSPLISLMNIDLKQLN